MTRALRGLLLLTNALHPPTLKSHNERLMMNQKVTLEAIRGVVKEEVQQEVKPLREELSSSIRVVVKEEIKAGLEPFRQEVREFKDEVLTSNDKVIQKLDTLLTEKAATSAQLDRHEKKIGNLESFAQNVSMKTNVAFQVVK